MYNKPQLEDFPELLNWDFTVELLDSETRCSWPSPTSSYPQKASGVKGLQLLPDLSDLDKLYSGIDEVAMAKISVKCEKYNLPETLFIRLGQGKFSRNSGSIGEVMLNLLTSIEDEAIADLKKNNTNSRTYFYDCLTRNVGDRKLYDLVAMHLERKAEYTRFAYELDQKEKLAKSAGFVVSRTMDKAIVQIDLSAESFRTDLELSDEAYIHRITEFTAALSAVKGEMAVGGKRVSTFIVPKENLMFVNQAIEEHFGFLQDLNNHLRKFSDLKSYQKAEQEKDELGSIIFDDTFRKATNHLSDDRVREIRKEISEKQSVHR